MTQNKNQNIYLDANDLYGYAMSKFLDLEYATELRELHNDYPLAPDKIEIKRETLSKYQLKIFITSLAMLKN